MRILLLAEQRGGHLHRPTLKALSAALQIGNADAATEIDVLAAGYHIDDVIESLAMAQGITRVLTINNEIFTRSILAEDLAPLVADLVRENGYTHVIAPASTFGKNVLPRAAALCDAQQISEIVAVVDHETFRRPIYAGNALATVRSTDPVKFVTVRASAFETAPRTGGQAEIVPLEREIRPNGLSKFVSQDLHLTERPTLSNARIVVSGGSALGSKENFVLISRLADKLGGAVGASRSAVDAGYVSNDSQVGQTGKVVAPDLYIAAGLSGSAQHLCGMSGSKIVVAINKDETAPIFDVADYGLVADLFEVLPDMIDKV